MKLKLPVYDFNLQRVGLLILFFSLFVGMRPTTVSAATPSSSVTITAQVQYNITIKVLPEKRIPLVNHWMNQNVIDIRPVNSTTPLITQVIEFDQFGIGKLNLISPTVLPTGNYDIAIKGYSHLRRVYSNYTFLENTKTYDLTTTGYLLLAGDMNVDNYINSLDLSYQIGNLYTGTNIRSDVNRDGIVNSLDISNSVTNLYAYGDN